MPAEPPPYPSDPEVRAKHFRARGAARAVVAVGAITHFAGIGLLFYVTPAARLWALMLVMLGAITVFAGLMGLYTYYENIEERTYYTGAPNTTGPEGVGVAMEKRPR
jgi:hypothetical protein